MNLEPIEYDENDLDLSNEELREAMRDDTDCNGCPHNEKGHCAFYHVELECVGPVYVPCSDCMDDCGVDTEELD